MLLVAKIVYLYFYIRIGDNMKIQARREMELLDKICRKNDIPLTLATKLIRSAKEFSYENVSQRSRIKEYQDLIDLHSKNNE